MSVTIRNSQTDAPVVTTSCRTSVLIPSTDVNVYFDRNLLRRREKEKYIRLEPKNSEFHSKRNEKLKKEMVHKQNSVSQRLVDKVLLELLGGGQSFGNTSEINSKFR